QDFAVLMMGLEGAGKSTFIGRAQEVLNFVKFKPGKVARTPVKKTPDTKIAFASSIMTFRDQSGAAARRPKWLNNISDHHSVCFIVDATNREGINVAFTALQSVLHSAWMTGVPLLILVNKLDLASAEPFEQIKQHFMPLLQQRPPGSAWGVMPLSALRGDGVSDAVMWLFTWSQT
ncbi:P-loop containing nucleoside triphosphate hydrolase protein, partial [Leucosporidium creatinivorum]